MVHRVMVVDDQLRQEDVERALDDDAARRTDGRRLDLFGRGETRFAIAKSTEEAVARLREADALPDAIVVDDYLERGDGVESDSRRFMQRLLRICQRREIPLPDRPRCVLWTTFAPEEAYTFCALGGLQCEDKRLSGRDVLPVTAIWRALAGQRWAPDPAPLEYPDGIRPEHAEMLPWMESGGTYRTIAQVLRIDYREVERRMERLREQIRRLTTDAHGNLRPSEPRWPESRSDYVAVAKRHGWAWVPLRWHAELPRDLPLPLVIDPAVHMTPLPQFGDGHGALGAG